MARGPLAVQISSGAEFLRFLQVGEAITIFANIPFLQVHCFLKEFALYPIREPRAPIDVEARCKLRAANLNTRRV